MSRRPEFPARTPGVARWSPSALSTYERCGERYRRQYVEREKAPPPLPFLVGSAVHAAARADNEEKVLAGAGLTLNDLADRSVAAFDAELKEGPAPEGPGAAGHGRDQAAGGALGWGLHLSPLVPRPVAVEAPVVARFPGWELCGVLDYADESGVWDLKTGRRRGANEVARSLQLTAYAILWRVRSGGWPRAVGFDVLTEETARRPWAGARCQGGRALGDLLAFQSRVERIAAAIGGGVFLPAAEAERTCSPKWCPYWPTCGYVGASRRDLARQEEGA